MTEENVSEPNWNKLENANNKQEEKVLSLTVDIQNGKQELLEVRESDNLEKVAEVFCIKYGLDNECKQLLINTIQHHLYDDSQKQVEEAQNEIIEQNPKHMQELEGTLEVWKKEAELKIRNKMTAQYHPVINENSKKMIEKRRNTQVPVHEQLYKMVHVYILFYRLLISKKGKNLH